MVLVNLTPHPVNILTEDGEIIVPPAGTVARCQQYREIIGHIEVNGKQIPITRTRFGQVEGLPDPQPDTLYIVSALVAQACPDRRDLVIPDDTIRDAEGRIVGCKALAVIA